MSASPVQQASESVETLSWSDGALLRLSLFLSQQRCHPHRRVNVSFLYSLFSILCCLFSALCSPFSILYSLFSILYSLFSILYSLLAILCSIFLAWLCVCVCFSLTLWLFDSLLLVSLLAPFCSVPLRGFFRGALNSIKLCASTDLSLQMSYSYWKTSSGVIDRCLDRCVHPS